MELLIAVLILIALAIAIRYFAKRNPQQLTQETDLRAHLLNVSRMSGTEFEHYMADVFKLLGYKVRVLGGAGDQGVDLLLRKGHEHVAVQCKNYKGRVGNPPVQQVYAGKQHYGANQAWAVAPAGFTKGAFALARSTGVLLLDHRSIERLIQQAEQQNRSLRETSVSQQVHNAASETKKLQGADLTHELERRSEQEQRGREIECKREQERQRIQDQRQRRQEQNKRELERLREQQEQQRQRKLEQQQKLDRLRYEDLLEPVW